MWRRRPTTSPPPPPPGPDALALHADACRRRDDGYFDPDSGKFVLSSVYLLRQGACCAKGCRHCPWPPAAQEAAGRPAWPAWPYELARAPEVSP